MKHRRKARELALQVLYACEMAGGVCVDELVEHLLAERPCDEEVGRYGKELVRRTLESMASVDELLQRHAANWELKRMAAVDRNILRMAATELLFFPDVPYKVVIDEAVEIAKKYGSQESGKFVNGIVDAVYRQQAALR
jgi:N utilization substance protein B